MKTDERLDPEAIHCTWMATAAQRLLEKRKQETIEMLKSCGIEPRTVPLWPEIWREGPYVYLERFMFTEDGALRIDDYGPMIEEFAIEPERIPDWIPFD